MRPINTAAFKQPERRLTIYDQSSSLIGGRACWSQGVVAIPGPHGRL